MITAWLWHRKRASTCPVRRTLNRLLNLTYARLNWWSHVLFPYTICRGCLGIGRLSLPIFL